MTKGWRRESERHSLASRGIRSKQQTPCGNSRPVRSHKRFYLNTEIIGGHISMGLDDYVMFLEAYVLDDTINPIDFGGKYLMTKDEERMTDFDLLGDGDPLMDLWHIYSSLGMVEDMKRVRRKMQREGLKFPPSILERIEGEC